MIYIEQKSQYAKNLIEESTEPLIAINDKGEIIDINEAFTTIIGIERENLIYANFFNYFTEPQKVQRIFQSIFLRGSASRVPLTLQHRKGMQINILFNGSIFNDNKGNLLCAVIIIKNTTEKRIIDLSYLQKLSKSNSELMMEIISLYLQQTPTLINTMKSSLIERNWKSLHAAIHKMLPSFSAAGVSEDFVEVAKKIHSFSSTQEQLDEIPELLAQLDNICTLVCLELQEEYSKLKNSKI